MGVCIVNDSGANAEVDKAFSFLAAGKWQAALAKLAIVDERKVSQRYQREQRAYGGDSEIDRALFPSVNTFMNYASSLEQKNRLSEAESAYRYAIALQYSRFSLSEFYSIESAPWTVTCYERLLIKMHRNREALEHVNYSNAMYTGGSGLDADEIRKSLGVSVKWKMSTDTSAQTEYSEALQKARTLISEVSYRDDPTLFAARQTEALSLIDAQIEKFPEYAPGWLARALVNMDGGEQGQPQAIKDLTKLLKLYPNLVQALDLRAQAHDNNGAYESAISDYDRALRLLPGAPKLISAKAELLQKLKRYAEVQQTLDQGLKLDPQNVQFLRQKSKLYQLMGNKNAAVEMLERAMLFHELKLKLLRYGSDNQRLPLELAELLASVGRTRDALDVLNRCPDLYKTEKEELQKRIRGI